MSEKTTVDIETILGALMCLILGALIMASFQLIFTFKVGIETTASDIDTVSTDHVERLEAIETRQDMLESEMETASRVLDNHAEVLTRNINLLSQLGKGRDDKDPEESQGE